MQPIQVFSAYAGGNDDQPDPFKHCPVCGMDLMLEMNGGRQRSTCPSCRFVHFRNPSPGVVVLIERDGQVLLGRRTSKHFGGGKWCLPCGFIEYDEDFLTAALREVKEETNLDVGITSIISVVSNFLSPNLHTLAVILSARILNGTPRAGDDLERLQWFPLTGPLPEMAFEADRHIIARYGQAEIKGAPVDPDYAIR